jgi:transglutaminase-like putative cysteine protease
MVFDNKYGDCKDKATFFVAVARKYGYQAYPVLLSSDGGVDTLVPTAHQFDHMIAAVAKPGGGYQFLDLTAEIVPYGDLPPDEQGEFGLLVKDDRNRRRARTVPPC